MIETLSMEPSTGGAFFKRQRRAGMSGVVVALLAFVAMIFLLVIIAAGVIFSGYNHVVQLDEQVKNAWAQIDTQLQRRYDLIPNLVETVRGYAEHEKEIFTAVAEARTRYFSASGGGSREERAEAAAGVERALSRLLMLQEKYPELKAQESFLRLQDELAGTENRLAFARKSYNDAATALNTYRRKLWGQLVAGWAGVKEAPYFNPPEAAKEAPRVTFDKPGG